MQLQLQFPCFNCNSCELLFYDLDTSTLSSQGEQTQQRITLMEAITAFVRQGKHRDVARETEAIRGLLAIVPIPELFGILVQASGNEDLLKVFGSFLKTSSQLRLNALFYPGGLLSSHASLPR